MLQLRLDLPRLAFLHDHCVLGRGVMPAAAFLEVCLAASDSLTASTTTTGASPAVTHTTFARPVLLDGTSGGHKPQQLLCVVDAVTGSVVVQELDGKSGSRVCASGQIGLHSLLPVVVGPSVEKTWKQPQQQRQQLSRRLAWLLPRRATQPTPCAARLASVACPPSDQLPLSGAGYHCLPAHLDASFHLGLASLPLSDGDARIPVAAGIYCADTTARRDDTSLSITQSVSSGLWATGVDSSVSAGGGKQIRSVASYGLVPQSPAVSSSTGGVIGLETAIMDSRGLQRMLEAASDTPTAPLPTPTHARTVSPRPTSPLTVQAPSTPEPSYHPTTYQLEWQCDVDADWEDAPSTSSVPPASLWVRGVGDTGSHPEQALLLNSLSGPTLAAATGLQLIQALPVSSSDAEEGLSVAARLCEGGPGSSAHSAAAATAGLMRVAASELTHTPLSVVRHSTDVPLAELAAPAISTTGPSSGYGGSRGVMQPRLSTVPRLVPWLVACPDRAFQVRRMTVVTSCMRSEP